MQEQQTVERLGIEFQRLGRKAFPNADSKELDRMLKGHFFQALHHKWQRKVGAPKTSETLELYDRTRTAERQENRYLLPQQPEVILRTSFVLSSNRLQTS